MINRVFFVLAGATAAAQINIPSPSPLTKPELSNVAPIPALQPNVDASTTFGIVVGAVAFCAVVIIITTMLTRRSKTVLRTVLENPVHNQVSPV
jgi:hypothetical protein